MREQREPTPFTDQQLDAFERSNALTGRERRLLATLKAKHAPTNQETQHQEQIQKLTTDNARLRKRLELLLSELEEKIPAPMQEEHIEGCDITRACPKCGRTKAFVKLYDFAGCVKCGRTWRLEPNDGIPL